jgi:NTE family protein
MDIKEFTSNKEIDLILERARALKDQGKRFSDIEDKNGNQYIDLVQEGGGVLGIALVGYTYVLENAGIRFYSLSGTSAGAINTMIMAAFGGIHEAKSERILEVICNKSFFDFVDGSTASKKVIKKAISGESGIGWTLARYGINIFKTLKRKLGLNPGDDFKNWLEGALSDVGINNLKDLQELRMQLPEGFHSVIDGAEVKNTSPQLAIITSDVTTHTKVVFPEMAELYWKNPQEVSPADLVRASMSIPFFFEPFEVRNLPNAGTKEDKNWINRARYFGKVPETVKFVDGGMLSNFPIDVFHREDGGVPKMPTFGARLSTYRQSYSNVDSLLGFSGGMLSTMRQINDLDFLLKNPDYRQLICRIKADEEFNWLNFFMDDSRKVALFNLGAEKAIEFLEGFNWEDYKKLRKKVEQFKTE